ncbi:MAG: phosphoribosylaminoimidazolesuccinocarboxamide synthase [Enterobacteriaceae bacterium]
MEPLSSSVGQIDAPLLYSGKVRELYQLPDPQQMLIVVTDRISAFDHILQPPIPYKGWVLNQLTKFWFKQIESIIPHHMLPDSEMPELVSAAIRPRAMLVCRCERIAIECVVRGYLAGNGWRQYQATGKVNGISLAAGLRKNEVLPEPIFTPALKCDSGHDQDISFAELCDQVGSDVAQRLADTSLALYQFAAQQCRKREVILVDCKFEFGWRDGKLVLIDEIFTPDSARFWPVELYQLDSEIASWDKEPVRHYLATHQAEQIAAPEAKLILPADVVQQTRDHYLAIYQRLTGTALI